MKSRHSFIRVYLRFYFFLSVLAFRASAAHTITRETSRGRYASPIFCHFQRVSR